MSVIVIVTGRDDEDLGLGALSRRFAEQDGLITFDQARAANVSRGIRRNRIAHGEWRSVDRTVIELSGAPPSWRRDARRALLSVGDDAAISHVTGGRMHTFDGLADERELHVTGFGLTHHTAPKGVIVHRSTMLTAKSCVTIDGMRVVSKPIALIQIAGTRDGDTVRRALDGLLRDGVSPRWLRSVATEWRRPGVKGPGIVLQMLDATEARIPRSWFQRLAKRAIAASGLDWVDELPITDPATGRQIAQLDLASLELMIGVECQSWEWHSTPTARANDARRKRRLRRLGWDIIEIWNADVHHPDEVLTDINDAVARRSSPHPTAS